ncbi:MAG: GGDEF domain-containing protein, partial [Lachnospiraceae bacterium]|nr:GGDEF domain-containing protein [Lachnospiraceae bacterium]
GVDQDGQSVAIETQQGETTLTADGFYYVYDETEDKVSLVVTVETEQRHTSVLAYFRPQDLMKYGDIHDYDGSVWSAVVAPDGKTLFMRSFRNLNYGSNLLETMKKSLDEKQRNRLSNDIRYGKINSCQTTLGNVQTLVVLTPMGINNWYFAMGISADYVDKMLAVEMRAAKRMIAAIILLASSFGIFVIAYYYINRNTFQSTRADLQNKADTDLLTELNNKMATERKIKEYIEDFTGVQGLLFIFDIDNFKKINDTRGHAFGDEVLREIGMRLRTEFRSSDIMGRVGGDEFILFLKNIQNEDIIRKEAGRMAHIFRDLCVGQYTKYSVTASIGCALYPGDADNFEDLYKAADKGLYSAKHRGKNQLVFYRDIRGDV